MDGLFNFLQSLDKSYKHLFIAFILLFPMSFIDCWKLSSTFKEFDILQQIFMASGISLMALIYGYFLFASIEMLIIPSKYSGRIFNDYLKDKDISIFIASIFYTPSFFVLTNIVDNKWWFLILFLIGSLPLLGFAYPLRKIFVKKFGPISDKIDQIRNIEDV